MRNKKQKRNSPIATLIKNYVNKNSGKVSASREEIQRRFNWLDWKDQKKILTAFLDSGRSDREWAYGKVLDYWDESFMPKVKALWETYHEYKCSWSVIRYFPIDYISEHIYPNSNAYFDEVKQRWIPYQFPYIESIRLTTNRVKNSVEAMQKYEEMIPGLKEKHVPYWIDEWVSRGRGFGSTIGAAVALHEMYRQSYWVMMAGLTSVGGLYTSNDVTATISSTGLLFKLFIEHQGDIPLGLTGNSPQRQLPGTQFMDIATEPSGSPTYPLDVMATKDSKTGKIIVSVANPTEQAQTFALNFDGGKPGTQATVYALAPAHMSDQITVDNPNAVSLKTSTVKLGKTITVAPNSVTLYEITVK